MKIFQYIKTDNTIIALILGGIITYFFGVLKSKKDRKIEFEKSVGTQIADSLFAVREVIKQADVIDIYEANSVLSEDDNSDINDYPVYPEVLSSAENIISFFTKINDVRTEYELYISYSAAAHLLYMSGYLLKLTQFISRFEEFDFHIAGAILLMDIKEWHSKFDGSIVKEINKSNLKLTSKSGKRWEKAKRHTYNRYWEKSMLKKMIDTESTDLNEVIYLVTKDLNLKA